MCILLEGREKDIRHTMIFGFYLVARVHHLYSEGTSLIASTKEQTDRAFSVESKKEFRLVPLTISGEFVILEERDPAGGLDQAGRKLNRVVEHLPTKLLARRRAGVGGG
jgi:hypothetical protein